MRAIAKSTLATYFRRGGGVLSVVALILGTQVADAQPTSPALPYSGLVTKVGGDMGMGPEHPSYLRGSVCPPNRPYYKPSAYKRYMRHRFRPFRDYYPFDPLFKCAAWPWSTHVCVGANVEPHPLPVGIDCVR
jgi:hypothetical protein